MIRPVPDIGPDTSPRDTIVVAAMWALWIVIAVGGALLSSVWFPSADPQTRALGILVVEGVLLWSVIWRFPAAGSDLVDGAISRSQWLLLGIPAAVAVAPLLAGVDMTDAGPLPLILVGYALTGVVEEGFYRGAMMRMLAHRSEVFTVVVTSVLFGAAHLGNVLLRDNPILVFAQAFGAFCFGIGMGAIRLRVSAVWPLMVMHFAHDLFLHVGALPVLPVNVVQDVVLLVVGIVLLRSGHAPARTQVDVGVG